MSKASNIGAIQGMLLQCRAAMAILEARIEKLRKAKMVISTHYRAMIGQKQTLEGEVSTCGNFIGWNRVEYANTVQLQVSGTYAAYLEEVAAIIKEIDAAILKLQQQLIELQNQLSALMAQLASAMAEEG